MHQLTTILPTSLILSNIRVVSPTWARRTSMVYSARTVLPAPTPETREVEKVLPNPRAHVTQILLAAIGLLWILCSCSSSSLPELAKTALDESIGGLAGSELAYEVVSAQKAAGTPEDQRIDPDLSPRGELGACPPDTGDKETWCVVVAPSIASGGGHTYSHFLVRRVGKLWSVEGLTDAEVRRFEYIGCSNWDAAD
jgi:hypothetical protein